jgi:hypothetical protein
LENLVGLGFLICCSIISVIKLLILVYLLDRLDCSFEDTRNWKLECFGLKFGNLVDRVNFVGNLLFVVEGGKTEIDKFEADIVVGKIVVEVDNLVFDKFVDQFEADKFVVGLIEVDIAVDMIGFHNSFWEH